MVSKVPGPDRLEKGLRIGCGALFGLLLTGALLVRIAIRSRTPLVAWLGIPLGMLLFAYLGHRWGDDLYDRWVEGRLVVNDPKWIFLLLLLALIAFIVWLSVSPHARF
jgi:hypothetical protein